MVLFFKFIFVSFDKWFSFDNDFIWLYWMMRDHLKMCRNLDRVLVDTRVI